MVVIILQMLKQVQKNRVRTVAVENMSMSAPAVVLRVEYMAEQLPAKLFQQGILGFKMGVKGGPANIRSFYNFSNRYLIKVLLGKGFRKGTKDGFP